MKSIWDWGRTPRTAKGHVCMGWAWKGSGLSSDCLDILECGVKIVGYEKPEFSEICRRNLVKSIEKLSLTKILRGLSGLAS